MRLLIVGCGGIGSRIARAAEGLDEVSSIAVLDSTPGKMDVLCRDLAKARPAPGLAEGIRDCDLVVEAASQGAAREVLPMAMAEGRDCMLMSVGALVDDEFREDMLRRSRLSGARIIIPSGAICGMDGLLAASESELESVELVTTKGPRSLEGAPHMDGVDMGSVREPTVVFQGSAREAVRAFPRNVNVAATVSLLGLGFDRTRVTVVLDPRSECNTHELVVRGSFGEMRCLTRNHPSIENPASSLLAGLSAAAALRHRLGKGLVLA